MIGKFKLIGGGFEGNAGEWCVAKSERRVEGADGCEAQVVKVEANCRESSCAWLKTKNERRMMLKLRGGTAA